MVVLVAACGQDASDFVKPPLPGNLDKDKWDLSSGIYPRDLNFTDVDLATRDGFVPKDLSVADLKPGGDHPDLRTDDQQ